MEDILSTILIGLGLSMDAFAVSIASGVAIKDLKISHAFRIALFFGGFQAIMPVFGWLSGLSLRDYIASFDHWVAFGLLFAIGAKMIYESFKLEEKENGKNPLNLYVLLILAIATSIDALAVGLSFAFLKVAIVAPVLIIGAITFVTSFCGVFIGDKMGHFFEKKIEIAGGLILIGIGIKIVIEHSL